LINATAYTQVDLAETETLKNDRVNHTALGELGMWAAKNGVPVIHFSTDYVFPGTGTRPWSETDPTGPENAYGRAKLAGENALLASGASATIFRTSWVYDAEGKNFFRTILRLASERPELKIVSDQIGAPTYAPHLAEILIKAFTAVPSPPPGIYHLAGQGETSWHAFATRIVERAKQLGLPIQCQSVLPIPSSAFPTPAKRPQNSRLNQEKFSKTFAGLQMPPWSESLDTCFQAYLSLKN
jgi:dTDP-4-dehydrorhamnose reductase